MLKSPPRCLAKISLGLVLLIISTKTGSVFLLKLAPIRRFCITWTGRWTRFKTTGAHQKSTKICVQVGIINSQRPDEKRDLCQSSAHMDQDLNKDQTLVSVQLLKKPKNQNQPKNKPSAGMYKECLCKTLPQPLQYSRVIALFDFLKYSSEAEDQLKTILSRPKN